MVQVCKDATEQRLPPAWAPRESTAARAEAVNCSAKGQGSTTGAVTFLEVKRHGLEWKLLGSLGGAGRGLFGAQQFSPLRHRIIDLLAALPFIRCLGAQGRERPPTLGNSRGGKVLRVWRSRLVLERRSGAGDGVEAA